MTNDITVPVAGEIMEQVLVKGDLSKLTTAQRNDYYTAVCRSLGLNPLTQPFAYITLNGKLTLYPLRACTDQLRQLHGISTEVVDRISQDGLLVVHVRVTDKNGRKDEDYGVVSLGQLKGDAAANQMMKAITKAKRRATLSLCGLGWIDESEIDTVPGAKVENPPEIIEAPKAAPKNNKPAEPPTHPETGEVSPHEIAITSKDGKFDFIGFGKSYLAALKSSKNAEECDLWIAHNEKTLAGMKNLEPKVYDRLMKACQEQVGYVPKDDAPKEDKAIETSRAPSRGPAVEGDII